MKLRASFVSNSSSSSFLVPSECPRNVDAIELPKEIWQAIDRHYVGWNGKRLGLAETADRWWLTTMVSDCDEKAYSEISKMPGVKSYLEGNDCPYGWYDDSTAYVVLKKNGEEFFIDATDLTGVGPRQEGLPEVVELRDAVKGVLSNKALNKSQKLVAIGNIFNY